MFAKYDKHRVNLGEWKYVNKDETEILWYKDPNITGDILEFAMKMSHKQNYCGKINELIEEKEKLTEEKEKLAEEKEKLTEEVYEKDGKIKVIRDISDNLLEAIMKKNLEKIAELQELLIQMII